MTGFSLTLRTENAAFHPGPEFETARILRSVARRLEEGAKEGSCLDANGNAVGTFTVVLVDKSKKRAPAYGRRQGKR